MGQFYLPVLIVLLAYQVMSNCSGFILEAGKIFVFQLSWPFGWRGVETSFRDSNTRWLPVAVRTNKIVALAFIVGEVCALDRKDCGEKGYRIESTLGHVFQESLLTNMVLIRSSSSLLLLENTY